MKRIWTTRVKSSVSHRAILPDGEIIVSGSKWTIDKFPVFYVGKYDYFWSTRKKTKNWKWVVEYSMEYMPLKFERCDVDLYEVRLKVQTYWKWWEGVDKVQFVDQDTGAYYTMSVEQLVEVLNGIAIWVCSIDKDGIITAQVYPVQKWGTTFLSVYTPEKDEELRKEQEAKKEKAKKKLKESDFKIMHKYSQWGLDLYIWKWKVTLKNRDWKIEYQEWHIFINWYEQSIKWQRVYYIRWTGNKYALKWVKTAYEDFWKHTVHTKEEIINEICKKSKEKLAEPRYYYSREDEFYPINIELF